LASKGISLEVRAPDETKGYGESMTIDILQGADRIRPISIRGTIAEGNIVISRINDFDRLYFLPTGHSLIVEYRDRPGILATITGTCADLNINIDDIRAPRDSTATWALAVLKTDQPVPPEAVERIRREVDARAAVAISLP